MGGFDGSNSKDRGDETEARAIQELVSSGYSVSIPFGDNDKYDLVVDDGGDLYRVQCKTAWKNEAETIRFNTHSQTTRDGEYHERTYHGEIDAFLVRDPETERLYWVDIDDATGQKMELRFDAEIDHPSINWAAEYEFDGRIPQAVPSVPENGNPVVVVAPSVTADDRLERQETADDPTENERFLDEELVPFLVFAGVLLALFPEPATSALGLVLVGVGLALWLLELLR